MNSLDLHNENLSDDQLFQKLSEYEELSTLRYLNVINNNLTRLPSNLPNSLVYLFCSENQITELPEHLPESLEYFECDHNLLSSLPKLPKKLKLLGCNNNNIKELPILPDSLELLNVYSNPLNVVPFVPYGLRKINYEDATPIKLKQFNMQRKELHLPIVDKLPSYKQWYSIMNPQIQASRAFDISMALHNSGLPPLIISTIIDYERQLEDLPLIPAFEINQMLPEIENLLNYTSRDKQGKLLGHFVKVPGDDQDEYIKVKSKKLIRNIKLFK